MNLPIQNPPAGWRVIASDGVLQIKRGGAETSVKTQMIALAGAGFFILAFITGVGIWNGVEPLAALLSWPTLFVLLPVAVMIGIVAFNARNAGTDRWFLIEPAKLTIHSRFDSKRDTQSVERSRILRFIRSRDEDPADPEGTLWWLDFEARGPGLEPDEIYIGSFTDRQEAEWFTTLFERWSGMRVRDEVMAPTDEADDEEQAPGENASEANP